ncbi:MAG: EAL domain-containing protein [Actinomycetales bacterium]
MIPSIERLARDLPAAVQARQIVAFVQPQISIDSGRVVAVELLSRWRHPEFGLLQPAVFIPIAEMTQAIHQLGRVMVSACCRIGALWQRRGRTLAVAVNVSPSQLATEQFYTGLREELDDSGFDPRNLTVEVTEATEIADPVTVGGRLDDLRELGIAVSIDDFGIGHSSVGRVVDLHATELKLDRFVVESEVAGRFVEAAIAFAHRRGMRTVGEGVETVEQLERLATFGCDRAQGYLIAEPASEADFERWMHDRDDS